MRSGVAVPACRLVFAALAAALAALPTRAHAQEYGPNRTLLMPGAYGAAYLLDAGEGRERESLFGGGARLMINLAPFSGPGNNLMDRMVLGGFVSYGNGDDVSVLHSGAELDLHPVHNPLGRVLDPFVLLGAGRFRTRVEGAGGGPRTGSEARFALSPGAGIRFARRGMVELRADARDVIVFGGTLSTEDGEERTTHNPEFTAGLNLRF